ncbi:MAG TPA: ankyrin repeat domain-containing protein [Caulobacteraceae bacterium]|nr:ankyrin repeat domain-containing protein [Caulobacteraceae bacterium]
MSAGRMSMACLAAGVLFASAAFGAERDLRLIEASRRDDVAAVKALAASGANVNAHTPDGATALHWAAQNDDLAIAEVLIRKGAKVDAANDLGVTPLWIAASNSSASMVARLLAAHANPNIAPPTNGTPLMVASRLGNVQAVKGMLAHGANPNTPEAAHGQTALMWAAAEHHPEVVALLLAAHADVHARSKTWTQRIMLCCQYFEGDSGGADTVTKGGYTPLLFAAQGGDPESIRLILAAGGDIKDTAADGNTALTIAAHEQESEAAIALLAAGADPNAAGAGYTALHIAAVSGDLALTEALLDHGADPNARQKKGSPTKQLRSGHSLDYHLNGATPYILAACAANGEIMKLLVAKGADPSLATNDGRTALMAAAGRGTQTQQGPRLTEPQIMAILKLAAQLGTPVNQVDVNGDTALHIAATRRRDGIVQALVDSGASLEIKNHNGETPLAAALKPPAAAIGSGLSDDHDFLLKHTATADLLRKLGAKS